MGQFHATAPLRTGKGVKARTLGIGHAEARLRWLQYLRLEFGGGLYHVTSREDRREDIFTGDEDRLAWRGP